MTTALLHTARNAVDQVSADLVDGTADAVTAVLVLVDAAAAADLQQVCRRAAALRSQLLHLEDALLPAAAAGTAIDPDVVAPWLHQRLATAIHLADLESGARR
ncbi:hypothetical protein AB0H58_32425 [Nocardia neocaledoniensis]|uniref:hypothetical protein n=1 Tax=Nocardia neocaledoniensis TaxID=236511 RepID=UPI0034089348